MTTWTADELTGLDARDEIGVSSTRPDGSLRPFVTVWFVRVGDDLYVRSAHGPENGWFRVGRGSGPGRRRRAGCRVRGAGVRRPPRPRRRVSRQVRPLREGHGPNGGLAGCHPLDAEARPALTSR